MDIRKNIIEFIPNLKMLNTTTSDIIAQADITVEHYKKVIDFYSDIENITKFESMILHLALYENEENRNMLFKSIEEELERFILLYSDGNEYLLQYTKFKIKDLKIHKNIDNLKCCIDMHIELSNKVGKCLNAIDEKLNLYKDDDDNIDAVSSLKMYRRKVVKYHQEATKNLSDNYLVYQKICDIESLYGQDKLFDIFCMIANFHGILSKYIPKDIASNNEKIKLILHLHDNAEFYDPECDYSDFDLDSDLNIIPKYSSKESIFDMELLSKVYKICNNNQFEEISQVDFFLVINMQPCNQCLSIKSGEKIRVCYLIYALSCLIEEPTKRLKWKEELLKRLGINENYYKSKYTEPIIDVPSKKSEEFVKALQDIIK